MKKEPRMEEKRKLPCPKCGCAMNHHAEKMDYGAALTDPHTMDPDFGAAVAEFHTCSSCRFTVHRLSRERGAPEAR
jgi:hypothetical protein